MKISRLPRADTLIKVLGAGILASAAYSLATNEPYRAAARMEVVSSMPKQGATLANISRFTGGIEYAARVAMPRDYLNGWQAPRVIVFADKSINAGACGMQPSENAPFYCPAAENEGRGIYIANTSMRSLREDLNACEGKPYKTCAAFDMAVLAHEMGHAIQHWTGASLTGVSGELQADCISGVLMAIADDRFKFLEAGDREAASNGFYAIGDDNLAALHGGIIKDADMSHGRGESRKEQFGKGFAAKALSACGL